MPLLRRLVILILVAAACVGWGGCTLFRRGYPPSPGAGRPSIPEALGAEEGKEPALRVYMHEAGTIREMAMEEYIAGVVAAEMNPEWPREALASQAIIARSFTLQKINETGGVPARGAHASTDITEFQAYRADQINDKVRRAVEQTRGEVLVHGGEFIRGWFHAYAGPRTALADEGLDFKGGNPPYIQIVDSPGKEIVPAEEGSWSASFPLADVRKAVIEVTGSDPGPIEEAGISERGPSGRITRLRINGQEISAPSLRLALGSTAMRSTFIQSLEIAGGALRMAGEGYGHGVGMCQWGARALAEKGWTYRDIAHYFYRDIEVVKLWD